MAKSQLTLRWLLLLVTVSAVFFFMVSLALRGSPWGNAAAIALTGLLVFFLAHAFFYFLVLPFAHFAERRLREQRKSPFVDGSLPPEQTGLEEVVS